MGHQRRRVGLSHYSLSMEENDRLTAMHKKAYKELVEKMYNTYEVVLYKKVIVRARDEEEAGRICTERGPGGKVLKITEITNK